MATSQSSFLNSSSLALSSTSAPTESMEEYPEQLTAAQQEAQVILSDLLRNLREPDSSYYARYGKWIARHPKLGDFCFRCVRPNVWRFLTGRWNTDGLKSIGGDLKFEGRGIYFDGVLGLDRQTRIYIGQSTNLRFRISQHWNFRHRRDNPSLHYHAVQQSIFNVFGILAVLPSPNMGNHVLPGMDCPDLLLNILEMWMCLVFRSLPQQALVNWLPEDMKIEGEFGALNIASPLDNGVKEREWVDLSEWDDPLVQEYLNRDKKKSSLAYNKSKNGEEAERKASRNTVYERDINIQISGPVLLAGAAILTGYLLLKNVPGAGHR